MLQTYIGGHSQSFLFKYFLRLPVFIEGGRPSPFKDTYHVWKFDKDILNVSIDYDVIMMSRECSVFLVSKDK